MRSRPTRRCNKSRESADAVRERWRFWESLPRERPTASAIPLTSIKMRLFSLGRSGQISPDQQEHLEVISGEIGHINKIVENFLEFARPPRLTMEQESPSRVVDNTLRLLEQRLKSYGVTVTLVRKAPLAKTLLDPGQLKEVLANIIINACEAMAQGGQISITEIGRRGGLVTGGTAVIRIRDSGPGIPDEAPGAGFQSLFHHQG